MAEIKLEGIEFFAYHGHHDEERITGNKYSVDIIINTDLSKARESDHLADTIDYSVIYNIIKKEMAKPARLLEHISHRINTEVLNAYESIERVETSVSKFNPPLGGICKKAMVTTSSER